jgi:hypothetical protein
VDSYACSRIGVSTCSEGVRRKYAGLRLRTETGNQAFRELAEARFRRATTKKWQRPSLRKERNIYRNRSP